MRRHLQTPLLILLLTACSACAPFENQFNLAKNTPKDPAIPLLGAYAGRWESRTGPRPFFPPISGAKARIVIDRAPDTNTLELWLAMSDLNGIFTTQYFDPANLKLDGQTRPPTQFTAKIGLGPALVLVLNGTLHADDLAILYKIVDVADQEVQHAQGTMTLHRVMPSP